MTETSKEIRVFLIDDDIDDQEILSQIMGESFSHAQCTFANDGIQALHKLRDESFSPDIIFLDINMPKMNGMELLGELKKDKNLAHIPVFMYSTTDEEEIVDKCKRLGAQGFVKKYADTDKVKLAFQDIIDNLTPLSNE